MSITLESLAQVFVTIAQEDTAPVPEEAGIAIRKCEGGVFAALEFNGTATEVVVHLPASCGESWKIHVVISENVNAYCRRLRD